MESSLQKCEHSTLNEFACFPLTYTFHEPNSITAPKVNFELGLTLEGLYRGRSTRKKHARVDGAVNKGLLLVLARCMSFRTNQSLTHTQPQQMHYFTFLQLERATQLLLRSLSCTLMSLASPWTKTGLNAENGNRPSSASELHTSCTDTKKSIFNRKRL